MTWRERSLDTFYSRSRGWVDGTAEFHEMCRARVPPMSRILEVGSGPSNPTSRYLASLGELHGVDVDPDVRGNDALTSSHAIAGDLYPFPDDFFDACVSNYVLEHVQDVAAHLEEVRRVLRPGGVYFFRTPNLLHYTSLVSVVTPFWFHRLVANPLRNLPPGTHDPYPTAYRFNTRRTIKRQSSDHGFTIEELRLVEKEPMYGLISPLLFFPFLLYERMVNATSLLEIFRANFFGILRRDP